MKKFLTLPVAVLAILLLASCNRPADSSGSADSGTGKVTPEPTVAAAVSLESCVSNCNVLENETGLISRETCRTGCYMNEAKERRDPELCSANVTDALMLAACLTSVAEVTADVTICNRIGVDNTDLMRGACYTAIVEKTGDASICEAIKDTLMYMGCTEAAIAE